MTATSPGSDTTTVFDAMVASLHRAGRFNPEDQVAPSVILWTDHDRQWQPLVPRFQERMPELLVLGDSEPDKRKGPAIWLRCAIARKFVCASSRCAASAGSASRAARHWWSSRTGVSSGSL